MIANFRGDGMHRTYKEIGSELSNGWGFDDGGGLHSKIQSLSVDQRVICLIAAVVDELRLIRNAMPTSENVLEAGEPSDGMMQAIRIMSGDIEVRPFLMGLSVRARKALNRQSIVYVSEITLERFTGQRNCGEATINELMRFKQEHSC